MCGARLRRYGGIYMKDTKTFLSPLAVSAMTFVLILGILSGVLVSKRIGFDIAGMGKSGSAREIFINGFISSAVTFFLIAAGSAHIFLMPIIFATVFARGLFYGFTAGTLVKAYALSGFFRAALGIGVYNFFVGAVFVFYGAYAFTKAAECRLNRASFPFVSRANKIFLIYSSAVFLLLSLLALSESFIGASKMIL